MSGNIRPGVLHLTQESCPPENEVIGMFRQEAAAMRADVVAANQRAVEADQRTKQLAALENQSGDASCSVIQHCNTPQHPHYDVALDDQSEDDLP